jgi:hypothetical protein
VLSGRARAQAKTGDEPVEISRMYKLAKGSAVKARPQAINQLKAVIIRAVTLGLLAQRIRQLSEEVRELEGRLTRLVERHARHPAIPL